MIVSFTGTRQGMTDEQIESLYKALSSHAVDEFHHGDCVGADADAHDVAVDLGIPVAIRPSNLREQRAFCTNCTILAKPMPPLVRNHNLVDDCDLLIATPSGSEVRRSGTWATIRYAKKRVATSIIWPDGSVTA